MHTHETHPEARVAARHFLDPLSSEEISALHDILHTEGLATPHTRFSFVMVREPLKALIRTNPDNLPREVSVLLTQLDNLTLSRVVVDLGARSIVEREDINPATDGWGPVLDDDFAQVDDIVKADESWVAAVKKRGITDLSKVRTVALSAGVFGYDDEVGRRMNRVLAFYQEHPTDVAWAHPIDGVVAHVDVDARKILRLIETPITTVPTESGDYLDPAVRGPLRTSLKPIEISQPEGVSFTLDGNHLSWENWDLRIDFNGREGLVLHQIGFDDQGERRSIINRASISEMVVNYGDPSPTHAWQNYFDVGEYQFGRLANQLELGCDCLGEITYLDAVVADDYCAPKVIRNAICIHEEDYGVLWKHSDEFSGTNETRRQRRLVVSFFVTVGNYDYGFYWHLYLDGKIQLEAKATGIVFTSGHDNSDYEFATKLGPDLGAPVHQHLFSARLDMNVDSEDNSVDEWQVARVPTSDTNPWGNALTRTRTRLHTEKEAVRRAANDLGRVWSISSSSRKNRVGEATSYVLYPEGQPTLLSADDAPARRRSAFADAHLWVTQHNRDELWAAGYTVNQNPGGAGLPAYIEGDRDIDGQDIVLWHTFGLTHYPRLEDWPIMPVDYAGFTLKPHGFFDRNPTLDVPTTPRGHGSHRTNLLGDSGGCQCHGNDRADSHNHPDHGGDGHSCAH